MRGRRVFVFAALVALAVVVTAGCGGGEGEEGAGTREEQEKQEKTGAAVRRVAEESGDAAARAAPAPILVSLGRPFTNSLGMTLGFVPAGKYQMGQGQGATAPGREVDVRRGFWVGVHEVTQGQFAAVQRYNPSRFRGFGSPPERVSPRPLEAPEGEPPPRPAPLDFEGADRPVEQVTWNEARSFCAALDDRERGLLETPAVRERVRFRYRLPSEAEWEYACRAGTTGFHYAAPLDALAWWGGNADGKTHPVGQKQPNPWSLCDMLGNVEEWCQDTAQTSYVGAPRDARPWVVPGTVHRVLRGGSFASGTARQVRCAAREVVGPGTAAPTTGFRVVFVAEPLDEPRPTPIPPKRQPDRITPRPRPR